MIHERLMAQGSFDIPLKDTTPWKLWEDLDVHGHIVIFPQWVDARLFDDTALLGMARYSGVLLEKKVNNNRMWFSGAGMVWWLGDEAGQGPIYEINAGFVNVTLTNVLDGLIGSSNQVSIEKGTVTAPVNNYTGHHQWETPIEAIRTVMAATSAEFRVNPDGTMDAGANYDLFNLGNPTIVVVRRDGGGSDPNYTGIPNSFIEARYNARPYITRSLLIERDVDNNGTLLASATRTATAYDMHGNLIVRKTVEEIPTTDLTSAGAYATSILNDHIATEEERLNTDYYEVANGDWQVGDAYFVYDPPAFVDTTNEIFFRGDTIWPKKMRLIQADWTIRERMGVYFRSPEATPVWTDLTPYVDEELSDSIGILRTFERNEEGGEV